MTEEGTTALCDLSFTVDLTSIQAAQVGRGELILLQGGTITVSIATCKTCKPEWKVLQVSCRTLYDLVGTRVNISQTTHDWSFYAAVGKQSIEIGRKDSCLKFQEGKCMSLMQV